MILVVAVLVLIAGENRLTAQWQSLNPGGGGQVQDIVCDPSVPGRLYLLSDMEGIYRSDNNGESWQITGDGLVHNRVFAMAIHPSDSNRLYVGTLYGLHTSTNGGASYEFVPDSARISIAAIAVDPFDSSHVIAAQGWTDDDEFKDLFHNMGPDRAALFVTRDAGIHWEKQFVDQDTKISPNIHSVVFHPTRRGVILLGGAKGVFHSSDGGKQFNKVTPATHAGENRGLALSPAGDVVYAAFATGDKGTAEVFAATTSDWVWRSVSKGLPTGLRWWRPEVDARITGTTHRVLIGLQNEREGLFEGQFEWKDGQLVKQAWSKIFAGTEGYDVGWDFAAPNPRFARYTPPSWPRTIWTTGNQNAFAGQPAGSSWHWQNRYCRSSASTKVWGKFPTCSSRGWASTFTYDVAVHGNYLLQAQGDNGWVESWDGGNSWCNIQRHQKADADPLSISDSQAAAVADAWGTPLVLAHGARGYGGDTTEGWLFAKRLKSHSPDDAWEFVGGGPKWKGGLPFGVIRDIAVAPARQGMAYFAVAGHGIYRCEDMGWYVEHINTDGRAGVECISSDIPDAARSARQLCPHPTNPDVLYFTCVDGPQGLYRGERQPDKTWQWKRVQSGGGWSSRVACWKHEGKVFLLYAPNGNESAENHGTLVLSVDEGASWTDVLSKNHIPRVRQAPAWFSHVAGDYRLVATGLAAQGNRIVVAIYDHRFQKGLGVLLGTLGAAGTIEWEDWTANLPFPGFTDTVITEVNGKNYLFAGTPGMGLWQREWPESSNRNEHVR